MKKWASKKVGLGFFNIFKCTFFTIWKRRQAEKLCEGFLRFVSILFLIFEKKEEQKNCAGFFKIGKYTFFNIWETDKQKNFATIC